jgi:hypothetical protein
MWWILAGLVALVIIAIYWACSVMVGTINHAND